MRCLALCTLVALLALSTWARDAASMRVFAQSPEPAPGELLAPRLVAVHPATRVTVVLDAGLSRLLAFGPTGEAVSVWPLDTFDMDPAAVRGVDALVPLPLLASYPGGMAFIYPMREGGRVSITSLAGDGRERVVSLPDGQRGGLALDAQGRLVSVTLRTAAGRLFLVVDRETDAGELRNIALMANPCGDVVAGVVLTGVAIAHDGRMAVGLARAGDPRKARYDASWLVEGELRDGKFATALKTTQDLRLFERDGSVAPRFRLHKSAPLFTSLTHTDDAVVSGGHAADPFIRAVGPEGLRWAIPHRGAGGQRLAAVPAVPGKTGARLVVTTADGGLEVYTLDGQRAGVLGQPASFSLAETVSLAADARGVYAATRAHDGYRLVRFNPEGRALWSRTIAPPAEMGRARPHLCAATGDSVWIGWRRPETLGVGFVDVVMEDGLSADPLWREPFAAIRAAGDATVPPAPLVRGADGKVYVVREVADGTRVVAFSAAGAWVRNLPMLPGTGDPVAPADRLMAPLLRVAADGSCAVFQPSDRAAGGAMGIATYAPDGARTRWRPLMRPVEGSTLTPVAGAETWGWLDGLQALLKFAADGSVIDECALLSPAGNRITEVQAIAGDGGRRVYVAAPDAILVTELE